MTGSWTQMGDTCDYIREGDTLKRVTEMESDG